MSTARRAGGAGSPEESIGRARRLRVRPTPTADAPNSRSAERPGRWHGCPRGPESGAPAAPRARWWRWSTRASSSSSRSPSLPPSFLCPRPPTHHPVVTTRAGAGSSATSSSSTSARPTCRRRHWRCSPNPRPRRMLIDNRIASRVGGCCIGSDPISIAGAARVCVVDRPARCELAPGAGRRRRVCAAQAPGPHGRCRMTCGRWARGKGGAQARPPTWRVCANGTIGNALRAVRAASPGEVRGSGGTLLDHHQQPWSLA